MRWSADRCGVVVMGFLLAAASTPAAAQGASGLIGTWACQTPEGPAQLVFRSAGQLLYNGESVTYRAVQNVIRTQSEYGPVDYPFRLDGNQLVIGRPDGGRLQCTRQAGASTGPAPGAAAGQSSALDARLQGMLCSYSSSPDGGYARSTRVAFDGRGGFSVRNEASWDVESGWGYGDHPGEQGRYRVGGVSIGSPVYLQFSDGSSGVAQVHHVYQGRITELMYEGTLFGAALCE